MTLLFIDSFEKTNKFPESKPIDWPKNLPLFICQMGENSIELKGDFSKFTGEFIFKIKNGNINLYIKRV